MQIIIKKQCVISTLLGAFAAGSACAQPFPAKAVRLVVPSLPGGGTDLTARAIAPKMGEALGQQIIVDNRAGAASIIGSEIVARAAPDGYTLLMGISTMTINPHIHRKMPYDTVKDFAPVSLTVVLPNVLVGHPALPPKSVKELIAFAHARPGQLSFASAGLGSNLHLTMELFLSMAQLRMIHVPYKGAAPGLIDVMSGQVTLMMSNILSALPQVKTGKLRAYGVTGAKRSGAATEIPTVAEAGLPGYEAVQWYGVLAPAGTPRDIVMRLHGAMLKALADPAIRERLLADGAEPVGNTPEEFVTLIRADLAKWGKVIRAAGIKAE